MNKTTILKPAQVKRQWHLVDAHGRVLGQVATEIAKFLIGKNSPSYTPHVDSGDYVVVINAATVFVTGKKEQTKKYYRHSGQPSGLHIETVAEVRAKNPERLIEHAVAGMLPKNKLQRGRLNRLKVYPGAEHPHVSHFSPSDVKPTKEVA